VGIGVRAGNSGQRIALPEPEGIAQQPGTGRGVMTVPRDSSLVHLALECAEVKEHGVGPQQVTVTSRLNELAALTAGPRIKAAAQPRGIGADRAPGRPGHPFSPQAIDEAVQ
jgi:hypothetical protein